VNTATFHDLYCFINLLPEGSKTLASTLLRIKTVARTAQRTIESFPDDTAPRFPLWDRDSSSGIDFQRRVNGMWIKGVPGVKTATALMSTSRVFVILSADCEGRMIRAQLCFKYG